MSALIILCRHELILKERLIPIMLSNKLKCLPFQYDDLVWEI